MSRIHDSKNHHRQKRQFFRTKTCRLIAMLSLTFSYFVVELVVGNITNSVALVADAFHMLSDFIALAIAIVAVRIVKRQTNMNTYGWVRAEVVGANVNTVFLLALSLTIVFDAIKRFIEPESIENVNLLLIVGSIGLGINIIGLFLFQGFHGHSHGGMSHGHSHGGTSHGHSHSGTSHEHSHNADSHHKHSHDDQKDEQNENEDSLNLNTKPFDRHSIRALQETIADCAHETHEQTETVIQMDDTKVDKDHPKEKSKKKTASMNMHGVFLHILADALGSIVVIISALVIKFVPHDPNDKKHWTIYVDPILSVIIVILITISAIPLFRETTLILLQTIPKNFETHQIKAQLLENVPEIHGIHELHVWRLTGDKIIASAHLSRMNLSNYMKVAEKVKQFFHSIGIHSVTIQYECHSNANTEYFQIQNVTEENDEHKLKDVIGNCLLRCKNDECQTQICCTKVSAHGNTIISNKNLMSVFAVDQTGPNQNNLDTQISNSSEISEEKF